MKAHGALTAPRVFHLKCEEEYGMVNGFFWIIRNIWVWPDSLTMCMGNPSWVVPVEKALAGERIALLSPTLVST